MGLLHRLCAIQIHVILTYFADFFLLCELTEVIPGIGQIPTSTEGTMYFVRAYNHSL